MRINYAARLTVVACTVLAGALPALATGTIRSLLAEDGPSANSIRPLGEDV